MFAGLRYSCRSTALAVCLLLVACGGDEKDSSSSSGGTSSTSSSGEPSSTSSSSGSPIAPSANVAGVWDDGGKLTIGADLTLMQTGSTVTGWACEYPAEADRDCPTLRDGLVAGQRFTAKYSFASESGTETVTIDLTVAADGQSMAGTYQSTGCDCTLDVTLFKVK